MRGERVALALTPEGGFIKTLSGKVKGLKESEEDAVEKEKHFSERFPSRSPWIDLKRATALAVLIPNKC